MNLYISILNSEPEYAKHNLGCAKSASKYEMGVVTVWRKEKWRIGIVAAAEEERNERGLHGGEKWPRRRRREERS